MQGGDGASGLKADGPEGVGTPRQGGQCSQRLEAGHRASGGGRGLGRVSKPALAFAALQKLLAAEQHIQPTA